MKLKEEGMVIGMKKSAEICEILVTKWMWQLREWKAPKIIVVCLLG